MSAPDTNVDKQAKRHRPALWGMAGAVLLAAILLLVFLGFRTEPQSTGLGGAADAVSTGTSQ